ncbi:MAG TPA: hypothetical protein VEY32_12410 [Flavisolibacter sp.]|jgi:dsDNA-specific endonuclease/ATPase MutS2|nr:hypothetical protein [Flavisolibacter sp.]
MINAVDKATLQQTYRQLTGMTSSENHFSGMENLFFSTIQLARNYGTDQEENRFLKDMIEIKENIYTETQKPYHKAIQKEKTIFQFKTAFKKKLALWIK